MANSSARAKQVREVGFQDVLLFACILEAKGQNKASLLDEMSVKTGRNALYLRLMLQLLMGNIYEGVERGRDMDAAKRLVALIHAKRGHSKQAPGEKLVSKMLGKLNEEKQFEKPLPDEAALQ